MTASANPRCRLAPRTSAQQCVLSLQNSFIPILNGIPERLDRSSLSHLLTISISNAEKAALKITHRTTQCHSISIIPTKITATAAPPASF